jgi:hypothetical protein
MLKGSTGSAGSSRAPMAPWPALGAPEGSSQTPSTRARTSPPEKISAFLRAHGVPCYIVGADVIAFGEFIISGSGAALPPWGYDVQIIRSLRNARMFCGY